MLHLTFKDDIEAFSTIETRSPGGSALFQLFFTTSARFIPNFENQSAYTQGSI